MQWKILKVSKIEKNIMNDDQWYRNQLPSNINYTVKIDFEQPSNKERGRGEKAYEEVRERERGGGGQGGQLEVLCFIYGMFSNCTKQYLRHSMTHMGFLLLLIFHHRLCLYLIEKQVHLVIFMEFKRGEVVWLYAEYFDHKSVSFKYLVRAP